MSYHFNREHPAPAPRVRDYIIIPHAPKRTSIAAIQAHVADHFDIPVSEMVSARRSREVARPRQIAMYLSARLTPRSLPQIGQKFGDRDHTTVIHAIRRIEELRMTQPAISAAINEVEAQLCA